MLFESVKLCMAIHEPMLNKLNSRMPTCTFERFQPRLNDKITVLIQILTVSTYEYQGRAHFVLIIYFF